MLLHFFVKLTNLRNMQKLALLKSCWVDDLYRSCFCLSPSPRLMNATVSNSIRPLTLHYNHVVAGILLVACCRKKRRQKVPSSHSNPMYACSEPKPTKETVTTSHGNPAYDFSDFRPENQSEDHEYVNLDKIAPPEWSKSQSDFEEQWYDDIGNKDPMVRFTDDPIYDCLESSQNGNHTFSFTNQSFLTSSDT